MKYNLINYGIAQWVDKCDLIFHVGVITKRVYWYRPEFALEATKTGKYREAPAYTGNIKTAKGYLIPPYEIQGCQTRVIPLDIYHQANFSKMDNTSVKGRKAELVIRKMLQNGQISLILDTVEVSDLDLQIESLDIIPRMAENIQVKCDWRAGPIELGGSGYLYIQTAERNPLRAH